MRHFLLTAVICATVLLACSARAADYKMANGETLSGELLLTSANDMGIQVKVGEGKYEKITWAAFSQEALQQLAQIPKLQPLVEPFIETPPEDRIKKTEVPIEKPPRLELPAKQGLLGALAGSGPGLLILVLLYGANLFAAFEIALYRTRPIALVMGVSAVVPVIGPILFLSIPTQLKSSDTTPEAAPAEGMLAEAAAEDAANPMLAEGAAHPGGLHLAHAAPEDAKPAHPQAVVYSRGQFTFNRRFFETKFPGFFGVVKREAEKDMVLLIKSARGEYVGQRISRIAANDLHLQVQKGAASEEVIIPFNDIQEIQHKHKDS